MHACLVQTTRAPSVYLYPYINTDVFGLRQSAYEEGWPPLYKASSVRIACLCSVHADPSPLFQVTEGQQPVFSFFFPYHV